MVKIPGPETVYGHCKFCGAAKRAKVLAKHDWSRNRGEVTYWETHSILECGGCEHLYHQINRYNTEDVEEGEDGWLQAVQHTEYWPRPVRRGRPDWLTELLAKDDALYGILQEAYTAYDEELFILTAVGIRTSFDRATEALQIDPANTFEEKMDELLDQKYIGGKERASIQVLVDAGSAAAHRGWKPKDSELSTLFGILESFIHRCFFEQHEVQKLSSRVPPKPKRTKKKKSTP